MFDFFVGLDPVIQALVGGLFTWGVTSAGASLVFFRKRFPQKVLDSMLGFAGGVMIAASFWSLLSPALELSKGNFIGEWFPAATGFLLGAIVLRLIGKVLPHLHLGYEMNEAEGPKTSWRRTTLLVIAITIHNIPEGMAIGVAFGAVAYGLPDANLAAAISLAIGIGIQNFPEGFAVSISLRREGLSRGRSFWYGQLSGIVEPLAAVFGALVVMMAEPILPYALAFAAGAMIFVVVEEVIPEAHRNGYTDLATAGIILGFVTMMILDVSLG